MDRVAPDLRTDRRPGQRPDPGSRQRPWVGRSYAHVVLPFPHLDEDLRERLGAVLADDGWVPVPDDEAQARDRGLPVLMHRWQHPSAGALTLLVLAWYPLVFTVAPDGRSSRLARRGVRRVVDVALGAGGRELPDGDLDRVVSACRERWQRALEARRTIDEQRKWLECRQCSTCGVWSAYGVLHCRGCSRRFSPADDAVRNERGRQAEEITAEAERVLRSLGRGEGLFTAWPSDASMPATPPGSLEPGSPQPREVPA